ncbi:MAG: hypothetical protein ABFR31_00670 [Thermodesulfobacteriota bacterium]
MPLTSFGSILTFAEEIETLDSTFYSGAANNPECADLKSLIEPFIKEIKKNIVIIQRTRRENVTEMILEPIQDFVRAPFCIKEEDAKSMNAAKALETMKTIEQRSLDYYTAASKKMKSLPEVANALRLLGKKHNARLRKINDI